MAPRAPLPPPTPPPAPLPCVEAAKAWFFGDTATVFLGASLNRFHGCEALPLTTSLQQSNQFGDVWSGGSSSTAAAAALPIKIENDTSHTCNLRDCSWVYHDGLVYARLLPPSEDARFAQTSAEPEASLTVSTHIVSSTEARITQGGNATIRKPVFGAFLSHSVRGSNLSYAWAVVPAASVADVSPHAIRRCV